MASKSKGAGSREADPRNAAILTICGSDHSEITGKIQPSVAAEWLAKRIGLPLATARAVAAANHWGEAR